MMFADQFFHKTFDIIFMPNAQFINPKLPLFVKKTSQKLFLPRKFDSTALAFNLSLAKPVIQKRKIRWPSG